VRRAIAHAIDRRQLNELVKLGTAEVLRGGPIPPHHWAHPGLKIYQPTAEPEKARELLGQAGYGPDQPKGRLELSLKVGSGFEYQVTAAELIKQQLKQVGVDVSVHALENTAFFADLSQSAFELSLVGWATLVDPHEYLHPIFHSQGRFNQQNFADEEVDRLLDEAGRTLDREQRKNLYAQATRRIVESAPMAFLYVNEHTSALRRGVHGYEPHPTTTTRALRSTALTKEESAQGPKAKPDQPGQ
jgi:peptide/nickel transport system substrate-binding protein